MLPKCYGSSSNALNWYSGTQLLERATGVCKGDISQIVHTEGCIVELSWDVLDPKRVIH